MAVAATNKTSGENNTGGTSFNTASVTLTAGRLYILTVGSIRTASATASVPTVTGAGQTWAQVVTKVTTSPNARRRITMFRALPGSGNSGALTIDWGAETQSNVSWSLNEFTGINTSGTNGSGAIVQSASNEADSTATGLTVTLSAFETANNAVHGALRIQNSTPSVEGGYTELSLTTGDQDQSTSFKASSDTTVSWTWPSASNVVVAVAVEIRADPVEATATAASLAVTANTAKTTIKPTAGNASLAVSAYDATVSYEPPPRAITIAGADWTEYIMESDFALTECANRGEVGTGGFNVKDMASALDVPALKAVVFDDPAAGQSNKRVFTGFTHERTTGYLGDPSVGAREWGIETTDLNVYWTDFVLSDSDSADRPAETDYERMTWLASVMSSKASIGTGVMPNSNTEDMEATDYRGRKPSDVAAECSEATNKLHFIYDYGAGPKIYYDVATGTSLTATLTISDDSDDVDGSSCFAPIGDARLKRSPDRIFSKVHLTYNGGTVSVSNATTASNYRAREAAVSDMSITDSTLATTKANALLSAAAAEITEIEGLNIVVPAENVNDVRQGQRVQVKLTRQGITDFTYYRAVRRTVAPLGLTHYAIALGLASDVLPAATGGRGADDIPQNRSNANDDGATVIIDRGGITVTDGAITVTNGADVVIIDGTSNILKIAATGTGSTASFSNPGNPGSTVNTDIATGFTYAPAHLIYWDSGSGARLLGAENIITNAGATLDWMTGHVAVTGGNQTRVTVEMHCSRESGTTFVYGFRYFVLKEQAF